MCRYLNVLAEVQVPCLEGDQRAIQLLLSTRKAGETAAAHTLSIARTVAGSFLFDLSLFHFNEA